MALCASPAAAQSDTELRLKKAEAEIRALQRKVFPDGAGKTFAPEITGAQPLTQPVGAPSTTAVTDILARLDALEGQLRQLTASSEENTNGLRLLQDRVKLLESAGAAGALPPSTSGAAPLSAAPLAGSQQQAPVLRPTPASTVPAATAAPAATGPSAARLAGVQAIEKPSTGDAGADEYNYGFRLWDAEFYPEAVQQLTLFVDKYPTHPQISYGRNLLGRAYLDAGMAREAAPWFLRNYQTDKTGARAGDSLLYLGESMIALGDTKRACIALAEFAETYPALATGRLKAPFESARSRGKCN